MQACSPNRYTRVCICMNALCEFDFKIAHPNKQPKILVVLNNSMAFLYLLLTIQWLQYQFNGSNKKYSNLPFNGAQTVKL